MLNSISKKRDVMVVRRPSRPAFLAQSGQDFPLRPAAFVRSTHKGTPFTNKKYVVKRAGSPCAVQFWADSKTREPIGNILGGRASPQFQIHRMEINNGSGHGRVRYRIRLGSPLYSHDIWTDSFDLELKRTDTCGSCCGWYDVKCDCLSLLCV